MEYYSIKVRASLGEKHISGAERIVLKEKIPEVAYRLLKRQNVKNFDFSNIKIEKLKENPEVLENSLKIENYKFDNFREGKEFAVDLLSKVLKKEKVWIENFINLLYEGASPNKENMRGAMVVNVKGKRIEKDKYKGVRTVLSDFVDREKIEKYLISKGYTDRTVDALALTTKNLNYPDILAEFCISDDTDYTTGYVSIKRKYIRISPLKPYGLDKGGRIYFVKENTDIEKLYYYLREKPVLIKEINL